MIARPEGRPACPPVLMRNAAHCIEGKNRDRYKVAKCIQAEPVFCGFGRSAHSKVISVSVLSITRRLRPRMVPGSGTPAATTNAGAASRLQSAIRLLWETTFQVVTDRSSPPRPRRRCFTLDRHTSGSSTRRRQRRPAPVDSRDTDQPATADIESSVGSAGVSLDNALTESVMGIYMAESTDRAGPWRPADAVEFTTPGWAGRFTTKPLLAPIGYMPRVEHEQQYYCHQDAPVLGVGVTAQSLPNTRYSPHSLPLEY